MSERTISSARFAEELAVALGTGPGRNSLNSQKAALLTFAEQLEGRARLRGWVVVSWAFATAAAVALIAGLAYRASSENPRLRASFAGEDVSEPRELWAQSRQQALTFSDGSELLLNADTRAQVSRITSQHADLRLNEGHILASIHKSTGITWTISVGPYAVRVVGTRFSVDWDRASNMLEVEVEEGSVRVSGGDLPAGGVALDAGARLARHYRSPTLAPEPLAEPPREQNQLEPATDTAELAGHPAAPASGSPARSEPSPISAAANAAPGVGANFVGLANKGKYREALQVAEKQGFEKLAATLPENDLVTLANAARFSGNAARARGALLRLRQRFPGRPAAELAALYLARVAEDLERRPSEAARWLRVFLQESPAGDLAAGARANLISVLSAMGDAAGARAVAEDYVRYHPSGPHLDRARAVIARGRPRE